MGKPQNRLKTGIAVVLLAICSYGLVGCTTHEASGSNWDRQGTAKPTAQDAAGFADQYLKDIAKPRESSSAPSLKLTAKQSDQLLREGKIDGISQDDVHRFVDELYADYPVGKLIYFPEGTGEQDRMQTYILLNLSGSLNGGNLGASKTVEPSGITMDTKGDATRASLPGGGIPPLVFAKDNWWIDGPELLKMLRSGGIGPGNFTGTGPQTSMGSLPTTAP